MIKNEKDSVYLITHSYGEVIDGITYDEESRKEIYLCEICKIPSIQDRYDVDDYRYWLCEDCKNYNNFKCDINEVMKLFGKSDKDKE